MMEKSSRSPTMSIVVSITLVLVLLFAVFYGSASETINDSSLTFFRYRCNITLIIQGDVSDLKDINRVTVFPNTTRQMIFFEEIKGIVDGRDVQGYLTEDDGNAILAFDFSQSSIINGSVIMLCFTAKIIQKAVSCDFSIDDLKKVTLDEVPLNLAELYSSNSSAWPISIEIYNLSHELAMDNKNVFDILSAFSNWMEEHVAYPLNQSVKVVIGPQYPDETYERGIGDCDDCSILFITMCRAINIPSFLQIGGIPNPALREEVVRYHGNYVYRSSGIAWHAWSMVYFPNIGWVPVDLTYFDNAKIERKPGGLAYIKSPLGLAPRIVSSAYFKANPIIYANITSLNYVGEARAWETAIAEGKIKYVHTEELEVLAGNRLPVPIEVPLILVGVFILTLFITYLQLKRRKRLLKKV